MDCTASEEFYSLAEDAFGSTVDAGTSGNGGGGSCPNVNPLSDAECAGAVSNCWSPGQGDTDCPNFGLCCFDGCANTCVDGPQSKKPVSVLLNFMRNSLLLARTFQTYNSAPHVGTISQIKLFLPFIFIHFYIELNL